MQWIVPLQVVDKPQIAGLAMDNSARMLVSGQENIICFAHSNAQERWQFAQPTDLIYSGERCR
jgi:hypothetical protein